MFALDGTGNVYHLEVRPAAIYYRLHQPAQNELPVCI